MTLSRRTQEIIEIDLDYCPHVFGSAPCTAALSADFPHKCWNFFDTCGDIENFGTGTLTLRFARNIAGLPKGELIYTALQSLDRSRSQISVGGLDGRTGPLGKGTRLSVNLTDFVDNDVGIDKYQDERLSGAAQWDGVGHDPEKNGLFLMRLLERNPYFLGRALRRRTGYAGQAIEDMRVEHYVISAWDGPDALNSVQITAKGILDLADDDKAQVPKPSNGKLSAGIAQGDLVSVDLVPAGVGDEYAQQGRACIGSEIVSFTRSGDTFALTGRGLDGSSGASHSAGDQFQQCYRVENMPILDVAADILLNYTSATLEQVNAAGWAAEERWLGGIALTRTIPKPQGVTETLAELAEMGVTWYSSERAPVIRAQANRPTDFDEVKEVFTDDTDLVRQSMQRRNLEDQRLTVVSVFHGLIDATGSITDGANYRRVSSGLNNGGESRRHGQERVHQIFCPWLGEGNDGVADALAERLQNRFEDIPIEISFDLDAKDRERLDLASLIELRTRLIIDKTGRERPQAMRVVEMDEPVAGHLVSVVAQSSSLTGRFAFLLADDAPDYDDASPDDVAFGCFLVDAAIGDLGDGLGPYVLF